MPKNKTPKVKVKECTPNGRILYDARSILATPAAQRHINSIIQYIKCKK